LYARAAQAEGGHKLFASTAARAGGNFLKRITPSFVRTALGKDLRIEFQLLDHLCARASLEMRPQHHVTQGGK